MCSGLKMVMVGFVGLVMKVESCLWWLVLRVWLSRLLSLVLIIMGGGSW